MKRVCVFVDGSNLYFALKRNNKPTRVDYHALSVAVTKAVADESELMRCFYYNAAWDPVNFPEKAKGQQPFLDSLDRTPLLELRLGRIVKTREGGTGEKGVDVMMATDMVYHAARDFYDIAVVVTEDQDFAPSFERVKDLGKRVVFAAFPDAQSREMVRAADSVLDLGALTANVDDSPIFPARGQEEMPEKK